MTQIPARLIGLRGKLNTTANERESSGLPNAPGSDFGWAQIQTSVHVIARDYEQ